MITWNDIEDLISKLGKAEKRFFKMMASTENRSTDVLVKLFDEIDKGSASIEKLERSGYYTDLEVEALYQYILKSLRNFYADSEASLRIKDELLNLRCLMDKAQYRQSRKMLTALKRELYDTEHYCFLLKAFDIEKRLVIFEEGKQIQLKPALIANEERGVLKKKKLLVEYHQLYLQIDMLKPGDTEAANELLHHPMLQDHLEALGLTERVFVLKCKELLYRILNSKAEAALYYDKANELFGKHQFLYDHFVNRLNLDPA
jgi:hypothetical protein